MTTTIQQTGKGLKLQLVLSWFIIIPGFIGTVSGSVFWVWALLGGSLWWAITKFRIWWNHS